MSASCSNMVESHIHSIQRKKPDTKLSKPQETQKQAEISYGVRRQDKIAFGEEGRCTERLPGAGIVVFLDLGGDYIGVHSVMIPLVLLICVVYFSVCG